MQKTNKRKTWKTKKQKKTKTDKIVKNKSVPHNDVNNHSYKHGKKHQNACECKKCKNTKGIAIY